MLHCRGNYSCPEVAAPVVVLEAKGRLLVDPASSEECELVQRYPDDPMTILWFHILGTGRILAVEWECL